MMAQTVFRDTDVIAVFSEDITFGPSFALHSNIPVFILQHIDSIVFIGCLLILHRPHRRPVFVDCHSRRLEIDRQCTHSLHRNDMACCHFELCRDCGLGCFSELLLADIQRLSVVAVVFLYQITFLQQNTTASLLELYFNDSMQTSFSSNFHLRIQSEMHGLPF